MNESGKTAILEALEDFNLNKKIREEAIPLHEKDAVPEIAVTFRVDKETLEKIFNAIELEIKDSKLANIEIIKKYPDDYSLSKKSLKDLGFKYDSLIKSKKKEIKNLYEQFNHLRSEFSLAGVDYNGLVNSDQKRSQFKVYLLTI